MRIDSKLKLLKYHLKGRVLAAAPGAYWRLRRALRGVWEPEILLVKYLCNDASVCLDIGAHFGMYTYELSRRCARVEAFEPIPALVSVLSKGYRGNLRVGVHAVALSDMNGETTLRVPRAGWGRSTIEASNPLEGRRDPTAPVDQVRVEMRTLDSYSFTGVDFIKMDVEGHELAVLAGASETLRREEPALLVEIETRHCHQKEAGVTVHDSMASFNYEAYQFDGTRLVLSQNADEPRFQSNNYLFLQRRHLDALARGGVPHSR